MRTIKLVVALIIVGLSLNFVFEGIISNAQSATEQEVKLIENNRIKALAQNDLKTLEDIFSENLRYTHSTGIVDSKAKFLDALRTGRVRYLDWQHDELNAHVYGNAAVLTGRSRMTVRADNLQQNFQLFFTNVYVRENGEWRMVAGQTTGQPRGDN